ncbi:MAG TPA: hypothetical protein VGD65_03600 [Chryseosolibacter sp.]
MTRTLQLIPLLFFANYAVPAQEVIQRAVPLTRTTRHFDSTIFIVNGYEAPNNILLLFKPTEIELKPIDVPSAPNGVLVMGVHVSDTSHNVLKYLKHKASMDIGDQNFPHGNIPDNIHPHRISGMEYIETEGHVSDILLVTLSAHVDNEKQKVQYTSEPKRIRWYDVDGKVMTQAEMAALHLKLGEFESGEVITGQRAIEKYGDVKYADGVKTMRVIKKKEQP